MNKNILILLLVWIALGCKKTYHATPTYAKAAIAATWAKSQPYYSPSPQIYIDSTNTWKKFVCFSFTSETDPDKISFANPYVPGKGTNPLYMTTLYKSEGLTSDSGYYNITIPKCFQFIPKSEDSLTVGTVVVLPHTVTIYRKDKSSFDIIIGPSDQPGTYNTVTGIFEVEVMFDESSIGGSRTVKRRYRFSS